MAIRSAIRALLSRFGRTETSAKVATRGPVDHVIIIDGTMSSLRDGRESNAGLTFKLISETQDSHSVSVRYEAGIQWQTWRKTMDVIEGRGINRQIRAAYWFLASRYRPGDRIFLFGYSRGAFAVRSLAAVIDQVGLLRPEHATERSVQVAYRYYERGGDAEACTRFRRLFCHAETPIEMVGVWDTVKALSFRAPIIWQIREKRTRFHNHALGRSIRHGYHALALDETRDAFKPVMWETTPGWPGHVEQVWFRGNHGDIGGQTGGDDRFRPLSNIPLVWMLSKAEECGLALPEGWRDRFPMDATAPSVSSFRRWGKIFVLRSKRRPGKDQSESIHPSAHLHFANRRARSGVVRKMQDVVATVRG